jgi:hypothetical protein
MSQSRFADPKSEITIKHLFGSKGNEKMTAHFLNHMFPPREYRYKSASFVGTITLHHKNVHMRENGIKLLCDYEGREHFVYIVFSRRSESISIRAFRYLMETITQQGLQLIKLDKEHKQHLSFGNLKPSFMLAITDIMKAEERPEKYIFSSSDTKCRVKVENPFDELNGTTLVMLPNFTLSQEQVKTPREK